MIWADDTDLGDGPEMLWYAAAAALAHWLLLLGYAAVAARPRWTRPGPPSHALRDEPPAVVSLLAGGAATSRMTCTGSRLRSGQKRSGAAWCPGCPAGRRC